MRRVVFQAWSPKALVGVVAAAIFLCALPSGARATTVLPLSLEELSARSDVVVVATVEDARTFRAADGLVFTETRLLVHERLLGSEKYGEHLVVRQLGGTYDGVTRHVQGDAHFEMGEPVVLFLADREPETGVLFLTALAQSKLSIVGKTEEGDYLLLPELAGLLFVNPQPAGPALERRETVNVLRLQSVRNAIEAIRQEGE